MPPKRSAAALAEKENEKARKEELLMQELQNEATGRTLPIMDWCNIRQVAKLGEVSQEIVSGIVEAQSSLMDGVKRFQHDRTIRAQELQELTEELSSIKAQRQHSKLSFDENFRRTAVENAQALREIERHIGELRKDQSEANDYLVESLDADQELQAQLEKKVKELHDEHDERQKQQGDAQEAEKKRMRAVVVNRLRKLREQMSALSDDHRNPNAESQATLQENERLSRELAMYEKEIKQIMEQNKKLVAEQNRLASQLKQERAEIEDLVKSNGAQHKATKALTMALSELQEKCKTVATQAKGEQSARVDALSETLSYQSELIDDLQRDLIETEDTLDSILGRSQAIHKEVSCSSVQIAEVMEFLCLCDEDARNHPERYDSLLPFYCSSELSANPSDVIHLLQHKLDIPMMQQ